MALLVSPFNIYFLLIILISRIIGYHQFLNSSAGTLMAMYSFLSLRSFFSFFSFLSLSLDLSLFSFLRWSLSLYFSLSYNYPKIVFYDLPFLLYSFFLDSLYFFMLIQIHICFLFFLNAIFHISPSFTSISPLKWIQPDLFESGECQLNVEDICSQN